MLVIGAAVLAAGLSYLGIQIHKVFVTRRLCEPSRPTRARGADSSHSAIGVLRVQTE